jgi:phosphatidylglycerol:prolipoprotein diacylglycerol transferase
VHPVLVSFGALLIPSYGALAAAGVLTALLLAQQTARTAGVNPAQIWNVCVIALFAALTGSRILLAAVNWRELKTHPMWMLGLATIHSPWLAGAGILIGGAAALAYMRSQHMPPMATLDALAPPLTVGLALEQVGALLAGAGFGTDASVRWAVVYTSPLAARWSGTPLGVPVHPVQAYAALAYATLAILLPLWMPFRRQAGDVGGAALVGIGVAVYITEFWRDREGRGQLLHGALDGPQAGAIVLVLLGAWLLRERNRMIGSRGFPPSLHHPTDEDLSLGTPEKVARMGHRTFDESEADESSHE